MNKNLIFLNPVLRFKSDKLILKFELGGAGTWNGTLDGKVDLLPKNPVARFLKGSKFENKNVEAAKEFVASRMSEIKKMSKTADERNALLKKADARANRSTKFPVQAANNDAKLQDALWKAGYFGDVPYEKAVDGNFGPKSKAALDAAKKDGYTIDRKNGTIISNQQSNSKLNYLDVTEIDPNLKDDFALWLYNKGKNKPVRNTLDVLSGLVKNVTGVGNSLNISDGTVQQAIALHLYDKDDILLKGDTLYHLLGYIPGTLKYKFTLLSGKSGVHNGDNVVTKTLYEPGTHTLGRYSMVETPNDYNILDLYNFNESGTKYALNVENPTTYDKIRYWAGASGANKDLKINKIVPKKTVLNWYKQFLKEKG